MMFMIILGVICSNRARDTYQRFNSERLALAHLRDDTLISIAAWGWLIVALLVGSIAWQVLVRVVVGGVVGKGKLRINPTFGWQVLYIWELLHGCLHVRVAASCLMSRISEIQIRIALDRASRDSLHDSIECQSEFGELAGRSPSCHLDSTP